MEAPKRVILDLYTGLSVTDIGHVKEWVQGTTTGVICKLQKELGVEGSEVSGTGCRAPGAIKQSMGFRSFGFRFFND